MLLRTKIFPQTIRDLAASTLVVLLIPVIYWFELFVVLPIYYELWSFWHTFHVITGTFILINVTGNLVATILCDTSIKGRLLSSSLKPNWRFCVVCETYAPPRSWHCNICNICILKRDHHCIFTGCCVGHFNYRYFYMFVFYMFVATVYASYYNVFLAWDLVDFSSYTSYIKLIFPLAMVFFEKSLNQVTLFLCMIVAFGCAFTGVLLYYHTDLTLRGLVTHERKNKLNEYDVGALGNVRETLGESWYLIWIFPFIRSELPHDGIHWETRTSIKGK